MPRKKNPGRLVFWAALSTALGLLHHLDHTLRANHVGWPVTGSVTPFTPSLLVYPLLIGGIFLTRKERVAEPYWLLVGTAILLLVLFVHFDPRPEGESVRDIYVPYADPEAYCGPNPPVDPPQARFLCGARARPWLGALAVTNMLALLGSLGALTLSAALGWRSRRSTGGG